MKTTQKQRVLAYLLSVNSITGIEAWKKFGIFGTLPKVIYRIKKDGYKIRTVMNSRTNRYGDKLKFAEYVLVKGGK